jgi:hypothetical protein
MVVFGKQILDLNIRDARKEARRNPLGTRKEAFIWGRMSKQKRKL